ncbi:MAG: sensor histidine kinase, partial [Clostridiales bacterium]|nr:sensor histidine kinase [Clostridiales bacterium]
NLINKKDIIIKFNLSDERKDVYADKEYIIRMLDNLISNAVKFTDIGGDIKISTEFSEKKYIVEIYNSCKPIKSDELTKIFDRFVKLDDSRGKEKVSAGLGLSIVKEIIKAHGEKITVSSDSEGITFRFTISTYNEMLTKNS